MTSGALLAWVAFVACAGAIAIGGSAMCSRADAIAERTGLTRGWIGLVLLATATSVPELVTGVSAVALARAPDLAVGDVLGSVVFNFALVGVVWLNARGRRDRSGDRRTRAIAIAYGAGLLALVGIGLQFDHRLPGAAALGHVGMYTPLLLAGYAVAMRHLFRAASSAMAPHGREPLRPAIRGFVIAAAAVVAAGSALPLVCARLAVLMGWSESFMGTLFVAGATSLPEAAVTVAALRIGAPALAIGNLLGSNLFDLAILAIDDLLFLPGPILGHASLAHGATVALAIGMSVVALRGGGRAAGLLLCALYGLNAWIAAG